MSCLYGLCSDRPLNTNVLCVGVEETHRFVFRHVNRKYGHMQFAFNFESGIHL